MTHKEFTIWLKGFLDASSDLTEEGVEFIKSKMKDITNCQLCENYPITPSGLYPPIGYIEGCLSPDNCCLNTPCTAPQRDSANNIPQPVMSADDYKFSPTGGVLDIIIQKVNESWFNQPKKWENEVREQIRNARDLILKSKDRKEYIESGGEFGVPINRKEDIDFHSKITEEYSKGDFRNSSLYKSMIDDAPYPNKFKMDPRADIRKPPL